MSDNPVVLTADDAVSLLDWTSADNEMHAKFSALATGRTVVVPAEELTRLRAEVEKYRGGIHTHGPDCWSWGWRHYECAEREIARLRARVAELEAGEPVAWIYTAKDDGTQFASMDDPVTSNGYYTHKPLYLGPQRMTEAQAREAFCAEYGDWPGYDDPQRERLWMARHETWLAALRHVEAIKEPRR